MYGAWGGDDMAIAVKPIPTKTITTPLKRADTPLQKVTDLPSQPKNYVVSSSTSDFWDGTVKTLAKALISLF